MRFNSKFSVVLVALLVALSAIISNLHWALNLHW